MLKLVANSMPGIAFFLQISVIHNTANYSRTNFLSLWPIVEEIQDSLPELQQHFWCLNDVVLLGSESDLIKSRNLL